MKKRYILFVILLLTLVPLIFLCSCGEDELDDGQLSVTLNSSGKKLKVTVVPDSSLLSDHEKDKLCLFSFEPGESPEDGFEGKTPIASKKADDTVKFKLSLKDENGLSRLYHGFAAAFYNEDEDTYTLATSVAYIKNPYELSDNNEDYPKVKSIKGICAEYDTDAMDLGVSHVIIDIPIEKYVLAEGNSDAVCHNFGKNTVFIDRDAIYDLDERIKYYDANGIIVYLRFILRTSAEELPEGLKYLAFAGSVAGETSYAVNMNDKNAARAVAGLADYLAGRYAVEEGAYGNVSAFIAGGALNTPGATAGDIGFQSYLEGVSLFARTLYTALVSRYENGRVYVTVDHRWKIAGDGNADRDGHTFLSEFAKKTMDEGDYPWGVAVMAQATSADSDRIWYDNSGDGDYLTPSNLGAICDDFLGSSKYRFDGEERKMIISDFSVETTDAADTEENQAASYAYAYYKAVECERAEAFVYSMQVDTESSSAGIRVLTDEGLPGRAREIYSVIKAINTDSEIIDSVEDIIGSDSDWESIYKKYSEDVITEKLCDGRGKTVEGERDELLEDYKSAALFGFAYGDDHGFEAFGDGCYAGLTDNGLKINYLNPSRADVGYVYITGISKSDISDDNLLIKLSEVSADCRVTLVLIQRNGKKSDVIYESTANDIAANEPILLDFDISSFRDELKKGDIEMRISAVGEGGLPCSITVEEILTGKEKSNKVIVIILIVLASTALVAIVVLGVIWFRKHYKIEFNRSPKKPKKENMRDLSNEEFNE